MWKLDFFAENSAAKKLCSAKIADRRTDKWKVGLVIFFMDSNKKFAKSNLYN